MMFPLDSENFESISQGQSERPASWSKVEGCNYEGKTTQEAWLVEPFDTWSSLDSS